jgi:hypothetical protein
MNTITLIISTSCFVWELIDESIIKLFLSSDFQVSSASLSSDFKAVWLRLSSNHSSFLYILNYYLMLYENN